MQQHVSQITDMGASLVAISPQLPDKSLTMAQKHELAFPVLSDVGNEVARLYGLVFTIPENTRHIFENFGIDLPTFNGTETFELPVPGTFVIDRDGIIRESRVTADYKLRMEPADIVDALSKLKN